MQACRIAQTIPALTRFLMLFAASLGALLVPLGDATADDFEATLHKANTYVEIAKYTERAVESWERYASWVNMKTGPTGKERYIDYGMYDLERL